MEGRKRIKLTLDRESVDHFFAIKRAMAVKYNAEVIRRIINCYYEENLAQEGQKEEKKR